MDREGAKQEAQRGQEDLKDGKEVPTKADQPPKTSPPKPQPVKELPKAKPFVFVEDDSVSDASSDGEDVGIDIGKITAIKKN